LFNEKYLYFVSNWKKIVCIDIINHKVKWDKNIDKDFHFFDHYSILIYKNYLYLISNKNCLKINKKNGKEKEFYEKINVSDNYHFLYHNYLYSFSINGFLIYNLDDDSNLIIFEKNINPYSLSRFKTGLIYFDYKNNINYFNFQNNKVEFSQNSVESLIGRCDIIQTCSYNNDIYAYFPIKKGEETNGVLLKYVVVD